MFKHTSDLRNMSLLVITTINIRHPYQCNSNTQQCTSNTFKDSLVCEVYTTQDVTSTFMV